VGQGIIGVFHLGLHLPLDADHRIAIPLGFDAGAGGAGLGGFFRLDLGLRCRLGERWFVGAYALNPSFLRVEGAGAPRAWSFASGLELGAAL
jgi:hypothetical protein